MDSGSEKRAGTPLSPGIRILACAVSEFAGLDLGPDLRDRKSIKFMAKQDCLALRAATQAARDAGLTPAELDTQTGVYLAVGTLPFEEGHLVAFAENSTTDGQFDMKRFSTDALSATNPILTFKCLPNMPLFHISFNLGIHGPYFVTYPGPSQFFTALEAALADLRSGRVRFALVGAVVDQDNFLVRHHFRRLGLAKEIVLRDLASVMVLTLENRAAIGRIEGFEYSYRPIDPFASAPPSRLQHFDFQAGAVEPLLTLKAALGGPAQTLEFRYEDGVEARIRVERA
jgi:hypothetical protein